MPDPVRSADGKLGCLLGSCAFGVEQPRQQRAGRLSRSSLTKGSKTTVGAASGGGRREAASGTGDTEEPAVFSILHLEPGYPAASMLRQGDALLAVNGCTVEPGNTEHALSLIRQASMEGAPVRRPTTRLRPPHIAFGRFKRHPSTSSWGWILSSCWCC